jgi:hypothetical protein
MVATEPFTASPVNRPTRMQFNTTGPLDTQSSIRMTITDAGTTWFGSYSTSYTNAGLVGIAGSNASGAENNTLLFRDNSTLNGIGQVLGKIAFWSADTSAPGAGVKAWISCISESATVANSAIVFATDTTTGTPIERMRIKATGVVTYEKLHGQLLEVTYTPTGTTQTITLDSGTMQSLALTSTTGATTATLTVPTIGSARGSIIVKQHGTTARNIVWAVSSGTIKWLGIQPTWSSDAVNAVRDVRWRWDGSIMYLEASAAG